MSLRHSTYDRHVVAICLAVLTVLLWWPQAKALAKSAYHSSISSYVLAVPAAAVLLLWCSRGQIFGCNRLRMGIPAVLGAVVTILGYAIAWKFVPTALSENLSVNTLGLVCLWIVVFLKVYGRRAAFKAKAPLILLLLTIPLPEKLLGSITSLLQQQSAVMAEMMFRMTNVPVYRDHFVLTLSKFSVVVGPQCSGIRSLVVSLLFSAVAGHLYLKSIRNRVLFFAITVALSLFKNAARIVVLALLGNYSDPAYLTGSLHREGGLLFFIVTLLILVPVLMMLSRIEMNLLARCPSNSPPTDMALLTTRTSSATGLGLQISAQVCKHSHP